MTRPRHHGPQPARDAVPLPRGTAARRLSVALSRRPRVRLGLLLSAPLLWLGLIYIAALAALLITAFWTVDSFTGEVKVEWTLDNIITVLTGALYQTVTIAHPRVAILVTIVDILIALPIAYFMAKVAGPRLRYALVIAILMPLWASYLVATSARRKSSRSECVHILWSSVCISIFDSQLQS